MLSGKRTIYFKPIFSWISFAIEITNSIKYSDVFKLSNSSKTKPLYSLFTNKKSICKAEKFSIEVADIEISAKFSLSFFNTDFSNLLQISFIKVFFYVFVQISLKALMILKDFLKVDIQK